MIYDFFTEAKRTQAGAEAAYALIMNQTRPFTGPESGEATPDTAFGTDTEKYYKKDYAGVPERNEKAKAKYYDELAGRLLSARQFARGEREITDAEKKSDKPITTEDDLRAEARKREMRWAGGLEGWNIVHPDTPLAWDPSYAGWLRVFDTKKGE
jgi:import inner membrane translocase subunit TIM54